MRLSTSFKLAFNILLHSKLRSWLTILGIVIGVAAVVAIVSMGEGLQKNVQNRLGGLGADIITVSPGREAASGGFRDFGGGRGTQPGAARAASAKNLTKKDVQVLQGIGNVRIATGMISGRGDAYYLGEKASVSIEGVDPVPWSGTTTSEIELGRILGPADYAMVVVGGRIAQNSFKQPLVLNRVITIEGKDFKIVGILKQSGAGFGGGEDSRIIMPIAAARSILDGQAGNKLDSIVIKAASPDAVDTVTADADAALMIARHVNERQKDYQITSAKATQQRLSDITQTLTIFLGAIAAVSLLVGAVGIANTMFTSVLEKTKEIGIMKAIGAKNRDILAIFMLNAALVGLVGGLLGIALGTAISLYLPQAGIRFIGPGAAGGSITTAITPQLLLFAALLAIIIGIVAGAIPAYRASRLRPADALRYE